MITIDEESVRLLDSFFVDLGRSQVRSLNVDRELAIADEVHVALFVIIVVLLVLLGILGGILVGLVFLLKVLNIWACENVLEFDYQLGDALVRLFLLVGSHTSC